MIEVRRTPITGPSVWNGKDLESRDDWVVSWTQREIAEIDAALRSTQARGIPTFEIRKEDFPIPSFAARAPALSEEIENGRGFIVMRGFPVGRYTKDEAEAIFWGIGTQLGEAVSQNARGELISHVTDKGLRFGAAEVRGYETQSDLFFHNDHGDVVGLLCLHTAKEGGRSKLVSSAAIYNDILEHHPEYIDELCRGYFYHMRGENQPGAPQVTEHRVPVFSWYQGRLSSRLAKNAIVLGEAQMGHPLSERERAPLDYIDEACERLCVSMWLNQGDMQFVSNYSVLHARTQFVDFDEPEKKRHLLRLWLNLSISRPLTYEFATRYGPGTARRGVPPVVVAA
ncbi:TauD/TfdA family dioxygenase [Pigmentiphaga soli]|uniref:TauD/TfdA family dioxygenase n=1 Tax=Pigmentiphaga soli TaxID=1007095 RepID=A0ABP8HIE2_9BURK